MPTPPTFAPTPDASVGLQCPYCQTALAAADASVTCGDCAACHHQDCWTENQGCAVPGCESAPDSLAVTTSVAVAGAAGVGAVGSAPAGPPRLSVPVDDPVRRSGRSSAPGGIPLTPQSPRKRRRGPIVAGVLLTLLVVGAVVGLLASSGSSQYTAAGELECSTDPTKPKAQPDSCTDQSVAGESHSLSGPALLAATQRVVRDYYSALAEGTESGRERAKLLLANDEQTILGETPAEAARWERDALLIGKYLQNAQNARVVFDNPVGEPLNKLGSSKKNGIARVKVAGMRWAGTECSNGKFEGQTWLRNEDIGGSVEWRLEPTPRDPVRLEKVSAELPLVGAACLGQ